MRGGRDFDQRDTKSGAPVAIVSETFARSVWGPAPALGRTLIIHERRVEVVGVVADTRYRTVREPFQPVIYIPIGQVQQRTRFLIHARVRGGQTLAALDAAVRSVDPRAAIDAPVPMRAQIDRAMITEHATQWIGAIVGILQLALAMMALWGLVAYAIERRTPEMGVRLALGATPTSLVRLMMKPAVVLIGAGVGIGCVLGAAAAKIVQSESVGLAPLNFVAVLPVAAAFSVVAVVAAWWPARRAGMLDPSASLRRE
jgi:predicted lysophospholipase L1 biosynthesis ABC-type transport system permease subunit